MSTVKRVYVEKKKGFDVSAHHLFADCTDYLGIRALKQVRLLVRYDIEGITDQDYDTAKTTIFAEPPVDIYYDETVALDSDETMFAIEYLPGQYDQRADSAAQCIQIMTRGQAPLVKTAQVVILKGALSPAEIVTIKKYLINPVDSQEAKIDKPETLREIIPPPSEVATLTGFATMSDQEAESLRVKLGLAMSHHDLLHCRSYFAGLEKRDPTITEIRMLDTYWSDHCRHTTFLTIIDSVHFDDHVSNDPVKKAFDLYQRSRDSVYGNSKKPLCLMDIATLGMKELRNQGKLDDLELSDEINACSIVVENMRTDGTTENWLVMFKNETHNHPTEIEPFGGAATCLGGAIRDPLSGRSYVYHAMRVTGSGDPRKSLTETIPGKLPQRKITTEAAHGYSSYGNQIGLATGGVFEIYDEGYIAKRMEIGAVIAAAPEKNVVRGKPVPGDRIILVGGRTGRDGCGGATGSSKAHTEDSITTCGAEVQKGNPPTERKIQRLFRDPAVSRMIKKCNDFGAGGVSVAIGELADGLHIDLSAVPKKYEGLDGTELAISESQERMAVLVDAADAGEFIARADKENLEATCVATVTADRRVTMTLNGKAIVSISRDFINTNGVLQSTALSVQAPDPARNFFTRIPPGNIAGETLKTAFIETLQDLNVCSQRGLVERFDSSIGAGSVLMPFGGKNQITPTESMVAKLPVTDRDTYTGTVMSYGFNPSLASWSPFHGALYAVVEAAAKVVAAGGDHTRIRLTLQEYFEKLGTDPKRWGKPFSALLGAFLAQKGFGIPAIGGKDSMSGTFESISVPPTLVAFAVSVMDVRTALSPEFKTSGSTVVVVPCVRDAQELPDFTLLNEQYCRITRLIGEGKITAAHTVRTGGVAVAVFKMALGNSIGMRFGGIVDRAALFRPDLGSIVCEVPAPFNPGELFTGLPHSVLGTTISGPVLQINDISISLDEARAAWESPLEPIFHTSVAVPDKGKPAAVFFRCSRKIHPPYRVARPRVFIPVFPGTNCEYDSGRAFTRAGGVVDTCVIRNRSPQDIADTLAAMKTGIDAAQIIMIPGGFSAGDEPDGSGKFIAAVFRNPVLRDAVMKFLTERGGLMLGICNGFQALIKLGLVPFGEIRDMDERCPTLTFNTIGRHASQMVRTRICSTLSPWFSKVRPGEVYTLPISHGEGRFIARPETIAQLTEHGQIATQYVDESGDPTYSIRDNPNGSLCAIEGITSPDDRILGKMAHSERVGPNVAKNIAGQKDQKIFEAGIGYFQ